jgi:hypothetical protein
MTNRLYKEDDTKQRWIPNLVWVQDGYWQPDPVVIPNDPIEVPNDPIDNDEQIPNYGQLCTVDGSVLGIIPEGYVQHVTVIEVEPTVNNPDPLPVVFSCWGPP